MREPTMAQEPDEEAIARAVRLALTPRSGPSLVDLAVNTEPCVFIAPVCASCGREVDRTPEGWVHVNSMAQKADSVAPDVASRQVPPS